MKHYNTEIVFMFLLLTSNSVIAEELSFDSALLRGSEIAADILNNEDPFSLLSAGESSFDVYLNDRYVTRMILNVKKVPGRTDIEFNKIQLTQLNIKDDLLRNVSDNSLVILGQFLEGAQIDYDSEKLALRVKIPQAYLTKVPKDFVPFASLDKGASVAFVNYDANYYHVHTKGSTSQDFDSSYLNLNGGFNMGLWRFRSQGTMDRSNHKTVWSRDRTYLQRAVPALKSELTVGETYTNGQLFSSLSYDGISLETDERMIPQSVRNYSPTIHGTANTNAKVKVYQHGRLIYQTVVPPGAFDIEDATPITNGGDLNVTVTESDGTVKTFTVPYSAIPGSMRPGYGKSALYFGKLRNYDEYFSEATYQYGLSNSVTANIGGRFASDYASLSIGNVFTSSFGALGIDLSLSSSEVSNHRNNGYMWKLSYNKNFADYGTNFGLAAYEYSSDGYRELSDIAALKKHNDDNYYSDRYMQKERFEVNLSQNFHEMGTVYLSGAVQTYRDQRRPKDTQYQFGYSNTFFKKLSLNVNISRQKTYYSDYGDRFDFNAENHSGMTQNETMYQINFSLPLGEDHYSPYVSTSYSGSNKNDSSLQTTLSGNLPGVNDATYNLGYASQGNDQIFSGGIDVNHRYGDMGVTFSSSSDYYQFSETTRGAIALHSGGITAGRYLSETFGVVEAKGAEGAELTFGQRSVINGSGYALVPSLQPYKYNSISIDTKNMSDEVELVDSQRIVAPYAGASVFMKFRTLSGYAALINVNTKDNNAIPVGTVIKDDQGKQVGMMGRMNQAYVRVSSLKGVLDVVNSKGKLCSVIYQLPEPDKDSVLLRSSSTCSG